MIVIAFHSFLNFKLCGLLSESTRFHKISIYIVCLINGIFAPTLLSLMIYNTMIPYIICAVVLCFELFLLFKAGTTAIFGVAIGSLLHLFVLRSSAVAILSIVNKVSMYRVITDESLYQIANFSAFAAQLITLTMFITLLPLNLLKKIMANKEFYTMLLFLTVLLNTYMIYNSNIFLVDYFSVNLAVQEIVVSVSMLLFFYIMMLLMIKIFNLGIYKEKTKELEVKIDKDKALASAVIDFSEVIIEVNCTEDAIKRVLINSEERTIGHLPVSLFDFVQMHANTFVLPKDVGAFSEISSKNLIEWYKNGISEKIVEYRAEKIVSNNLDTANIESDENYLWHKMRIKISQENENEDIIAIITVDEFDEEKQNEILLKKKAETDQLTGAYNRLAFEEKVNEYMSVADAMGTLYMLDLDNFKGINDNMGHLAGDDVLREVYAKIMSIFRAGDIIARVGGDEFVVFLCGITKEETICKKAQQICDQIRKVYHAENGVNIEISSSIGIAFAPKHGTNFESLFEMADMAMYYSKSKGKNVYTIFESDVLTGFKANDREKYSRENK